MTMTTTSEIPERIAERLIEYTELVDDECLVSQYSTTKAGYSQIGWNENGTRFVMLGHRVAWIIAYGPIPEGATVDHVCRNRRCVNVQHLRLLSNFENGRRNQRGDWPLGQCRNGHSNEFLTKRPDGRLGCSICMQDWVRRSNERARYRRATDPSYAENRREAERRYDAKRRRKDAR